MSSTTATLEWAGPRQTRRQQETQYGYCRNGGKDQFKTPGIRIEGQQIEQLVQGKKHEADADEYATEIMELRVWRAPEQYYADQDQNR